MLKYKSDRLVISVTSQRRTFRKAVVDFDLIFVQQSFQLNIDPNLPQIYLVLRSTIAVQKMVRTL